MKVAASGFRKLRTAPTPTLSLKACTDRLSLLAAGGYRLGLCVWLLVVWLPIATNAAEPIKVEQLDAATNAPDEARGQQDLIVEGKVFIRKIEVRGDALYPEHGITDAFINARVKAFMRHSSGWLSVSDMHRMADDLTVAYHEKGLTFNQAFVLPQEIANHTLTLNVLAGRLGEINVMNSRLYERDLISGEFDHLIGKVIYEPDIKQAVERVNDLPGLRVFGFYSVGRRQGETRLNLRVLSEQSSSTSVTIDNWGHRDTGSHRLSVMHGINNVTGRADILQGQILATEESGNLYGGLYYLSPITGSVKLQASVSRNEFEVAGQFADFGLTGNLSSLAVVLSGTLLDDPYGSASSRLTAATKKAVTDSDLFGSVFASTIRYKTLEPSIHLSALNPEWQVSQGLRTSLVIGSIDASDDDTVDDDFYIIKLQYEIQHLWFNQLLDRQTSSLGLWMHYTDQVLPDAERPLLTGPLAVRGYKPALFSADRSALLRLEHRFAGIGFGKQLRTYPFLFLDAVKAEQNAQAQDDVFFSAAGVGIEMEWRKTASGGFSAGYPLEQHSSTTLSLEDYDPVVYGYFKLQF